MSLLSPPGFTILPDRSVRFTLHAPGAQSVRLVADFTHWTAAALTLAPGPGGNWEAQTPPLPEGVHFYKYIVDGRWTHDSSHPLVENDGCGGWNSVFGIGGPVPGAASNLRIVSLNLHTYQEEHAVLKLEQVAFTLAALGVDAVALQEVGEHVSDPDRPNAGELIRTRLQAFTGQPWAYAWRVAHTGFEVYREGVSLLARVPAADVCEYRLSSGRLARNALAGTFNLGGVSLRLVTTHLTWPTGGGLKEAQQLLDALQGEPRDSYAALLLAGDFNAEPEDPQVREVRQAGYLDVAHETHRERETWPTATPQVWQALLATAAQNPRSPGRVLASRIDYQFLRAAPGSSVRPLACMPVFNGLVVGDVYQPYVSDHIGILGVYAV
jgi:endonuclease/exonuclease/phosphatase family metal-dependent hydrolase